jgi:tryptophan synthase alpha subunit
VSAVEKIFEAARAEGRAALVGYLPAGYPTVDGSVEMLSAMVEGGCDLLEVGVPYSDPVMDGPTIQAAADTALRAGVRLRDVFGVVERVAAAGGQAVVMTDFNPVLRYGVDAFALLCRTEGIIPAIESAHAIAGSLRLGRELGPESVILVNLSGRGDKDVDTARKWFKL